MFSWQKLWFCAFFVYLQKLLRMKLKNVTIFVGVLILLDQILKIWIKTNLALDESIEIFSWFHLHFVENNGAAFGMQLRTGGEFDWGKLLLSLFRVVMIGLLGYYIHHLSRPERKTPRGVIIGMALITFRLLPIIKTQVRGFLQLSLLIIAILQKWVSSVLWHFFY